MTHIYITLALSLLSACIAYAMAPVSEVAVATVVFFATTVTGLALHAVCTDAEIL